MHNLTMTNERQKMSFWIDVLFDSDLANDTIHEMPADGLNVETVYREAHVWLNEHPITFDMDDSGQTGLPDIEESSYSPDAGEPYPRVSHEIDRWWKRVRDVNFEGWVSPMETVESAMARAQTCKDNAMTRYIPRVEPEPDHGYVHEEQYDEDHESVGRADFDERSLQADDGEEEDDGDEEEEEEEEEEDDDDNESYNEGPLRGLLTEVPNILEPKQIEALHMTVKACIVDIMGSGLTPSGENLQKTRAKMFLAMDCGKNLLREMLVFIAVWDQGDDQFIFQITAQIIESFHHNALLPYAWNSLRILKDIVSPAQTVLLRLMNYMFRARKDSCIYDEDKEYQRDAKLIHFLYNYFRCRVVPDCIALIYAQAQIRANQCHPSDFPVDLWDMERAKDGLSQYLDFISVIADIPEMRPLLIQWDAIYELVALLSALEAGVARLPIDARPVPGTGRAHVPPLSDPKGANAQAQPQASTTPSVERPYDTQPSPAHPTQPGLPPLHDTPHLYPWTGVKTQILMILTSLVAPLDGRRGPGNPDVQRQILKYGGVMALLNCCVYDGHNDFLKERATLAIKWVMDGCDEAQEFVRELTPLPDQSAAQAMPREF